MKPLNFINMEDNLQVIGFGKEGLKGAIGKNWMDPESWNLPSNSTKEAVILVWQSHLLSKEKQTVKPIVRLADLLPELNIFRQKR